MMSDQAYIRMLELKLTALCQHLGVTIQRGENQLGTDDLVAHWVVVPVCKECGK